MSYSDSVSLPRLSSRARDVNPVSHYLTIRLPARDFYAVTVDEGEARINYHRIEIETE